MAVNEETHAKIGLVLPKTKRLFEKEEKFLGAAFQSKKGGIF
ncbi:hypothetical protein [Novacetimonas hansenii]|nr:hypothetical protein [Novacetimonas hansenii]